MPSHTWVSRTWTCRTAPTGCGSSAMRWGSTSVEVRSQGQLAGPRSSRLPMKVQLEKCFAIPASADTAWTLLQDIERVAGCMPGAKITERIDDRHYKGTVSVKFGP